MPAPRPVLAAAAAALTLALGTAALAPAVAEDVDAAPTHFLSGDQTAISSPIDVALDAEDNRYVANVNGDAVVVFPPEATGNVAPARLIAGPATGLTAPRAVVVDEAGLLYVADGGPAPWTIRVFAAGADGDVAPVRVIGGAATQLGWPAAIALDSDGRLFVADRNSDSILVFPPGTSGNVAPFRVISGAMTQLDGVRGIAVDEANRVHVTNFNSRSITTYAAGATGDVAPVRVIAGELTQLTAPWAVALDTLGNVYATNYTEFSAPPEGRSVVVFSPDADGDVAPIHRLTGPNTDLGDGYSLAVDAHRRVVAGNLYGASWLATYAPLVADPSARPGKVTGLKVLGKPAAAHRKVVWKAPDFVGSGITGYRVTVKKGTSVRVSSTVTATRLVVDRASLGRGKHAVRVVAVNADGAGPAAVVRFTVR